MTVLGSMLRASLEDPQIPISSSTIATLFPGGRASLAGVAVSEQRVYGTSAWFRGVALLSGTMAALPLRVYRQGTRTRVAQKTVLDSPNPAQTPFEFWQTMYANAISWGNAYGAKVRDGAGNVSKVWPLHPSAVHIERVRSSPQNPAGKVFHVLDMDGIRVPLTGDDVFHLPYLSPYGFEGLSPLRFAREILGLNIAMEETAGRLFGEGLRISGVLQTDSSLTEDQADKLKRNWRAKVAGATHAGDIAVLDNGAKFQGVSLPPHEAQLLESRKFGVVEVARLLGIAPHLLMDVERSTSWGTGIEQQSIGLVRYTLQGWITAGEQRITRELLPGGWNTGIWIGEYDLDGLLRGDSAAFAAYLHSLIIDGVITRNEGRDMLGREPADGLDDFLVPSNLTLISVDGNLVPLAAQNPAIDSAPDTEGETTDASVN